MSDTPTAPDSGGNPLSKKVGGIKIQYLLIFGLAVAIGAYYWRKIRAKNNPVVPPMVDTSGAAGGPTTSSSNGGSGGIGNPLPPVPQTNGQWASSALNAAIGNGSVDATAGANAVSAYLNGQQLTTSQANIIGKLTTAYGQPPEGVLPISTTAPVVPINNAPVRYIRASSGAISAQTADGHTYGITYPEWVALEAQGAKYTQVTDTEYNSATSPTHN